MMIYTVLRFLAKVLSNLLLKVHVYGRENIPHGGGFIVASNHASNLDPVLLGIACPRKLNYMAKSELFNNFLFAALLRRIGVFPVKRKSVDIGSIKEALHRLGQGKGLLLFPEGRRASDGKLGEPLAGVGFLASKTNVPIIPAFIRGTDKALPRGAKFITPTEVAIYFGEQIPMERRLPYSDIAHRIMDNIRQLSCLAVQ